MEPDVRWLIIDKASSFDAFKKNFVPKTQIADSVDIGIKTHYEITKKLIIHSYFEYEFITVALRNGLLLLEFTLNHYYEKINGVKCKMMLAASSKWFKNQNLIEGEEEMMVVDLIRVIRNYHMHPQTHTVLPPSAIDVIELIAVWINKLDERVSKLLSLD
ncbi:hypothetical protein ABIB40_001508 [Pedobacter sp. UYP30]|uniref:hypothetical protein n=1 Tax=Pedobacter sp. UYP30 TaxID=1756400 RepID=UPI0033960FB3